MTTAPFGNLVVHRRDVENDDDQIVRFGRAMRWPRLLGMATLLAQGWVYQMLHPALLWLLIGVEVGVVASQGRLLGEGVARTALHRRATALLIVDLLVVYAGGTLFTPDAAWIGYFAYPLLSLEATLIVGAWAGLTVTGMSIVVFLAQFVLHVALGHPAEPRSAMGAVTLIALTGGCVTLHAYLTGRGRDHLRTLLQLTSELARHDSLVEAMRHIDQRLHAAVGARIGSVAVRDLDGRYRVTRWQTGEERVLSPEQMLRVFGDVDLLTRRLESGDAVTVETDPWSLVTAALELPEWATAITLVPIVAEGRWVGMLPVLWATRTDPDADQLRLLHGLAGQIGLALARAELEQMRRDATVDPLTGLLNRRAIGAELEAFVARSARSGAPLAILVLELDPDRRMPDPAEATLRSVAMAVRAVMRSGDVAGRHDDGRLLVIAADADAQAGRALAGRITTEVAAIPRAHTLRLAIGIAAFPDDGRASIDLLDAADAALAATGPWPAPQEDVAIDEDVAAFA